MSSNLNIPIRDGGPTVEDLYSPAKQKAANRGGTLLAASYRRGRLLLLSPARPKLILSLLLLLSLAALAVSRLGTPSGWALPPPPTPPSYAVLINTWRQGSPLKQTASHYASCPGADGVHVAWAGSDLPGSDLRDYLEKLGVVVQAASGSRFDAVGIGSGAVFSVDDGVIVPCSDLSFAFQVWRSAPQTMVGFVPRMHWLDHQGNGKVYYKYGGWWSVWWRGAFSMVLAKAAFFHSKYFDLYANSMPASVKDYIARERNCEDIAMSMLVANASGAPPIWVKGKVHEIGSQTISSLRGYSQWRNDCLNDLISLYGSAPLIPTNAKAVDSRHAWFW